MLDVDAGGLDVMDRKLLSTVLEKFAGGPVGVDNLAAAIGEERDTIEDVLEPYLIQQGFLQRTSRGRIATALSYRHFGLAPPTPGAAATVPANERPAAGPQRVGERLSARQRVHAHLACGAACRALPLPGARLLRGHRRRRRRVLRELPALHGARAHRVAVRARLRARRAGAGTRRRIRGPSRGHPLPPAGAARRPARRDGRADGARPRAARARPAGAARRRGADRRPRHARLPRPRPLAAGAHPRAARPRMENPA